MKIEPLDDYVLVQRLDNDETTPGGIIIPEVARKLQTKGVIRAIGPERYLNARREVLSA